MSSYKAFPTRDHDEIASFYEGVHGSDGPGCDFVRRSKGSVAGRVLSTVGMSVAFLYSGGRTSSFGWVVGFVESEKYALFKLPLRFMRYGFALSDSLAGLTAGRGARRFPPKGN
jgi:hypothetical protein